IHVAVVPLAALLHREVAARVRSAERGSLIDGADETAGFARDPGEFPSHAEVEGEIAAVLPIVLREEDHFLNIEITYTLRDGRIEGVEIAEILLHDLVHASKHIVVELLESCSVG